MFGGQSFGFGVAFCWRLAFSLGSFGRVAFHLSWFPLATSFVVLSAPSASHATLPYRLCVACLLLLSRARWAPFCVRAAQV